MYTRRPPVDVATSTGGPGAKKLEQLAELGALAAHFGTGAFITLLDNNIVNVAGPGRVKVNRQQPPGT